MHGQFFYTHQDKSREYLEHCIRTHLEYLQQPCRATLCDTSDATVTMLVEMRGVCKNMMLYGLETRKRQTPSWKSFRGPGGYQPIATASIDVDTKIGL